MSFLTCIARRARPLSRLALLVVPALGVGSDLAFEEVAREAGVSFHHDASKSAEKYLIEAMGAGVAVLDYDGDGLLDIYFVNGADLSGVSESGIADKTAPRFWNRLYRNLGDWQFEDVTEKARVAGYGYGMGVAVADYDGDGDQDMFVSNFGPDDLYQNQGNGTFLEVGTESGIEGAGWSSGAAFLDFDRDGRLDLFVASYLDWTFAGSQPCGPFLPERRSYCHPRAFGPARHALFRNIGNGRFRDVSESTGIASSPGKGLGVGLNDYDSDGWVDVFVANDSYPQQLFRNVDGTRFEEVAVQVGAAYDSEGRDYAGMGVAWQDYDGDLMPDILVNALGLQGYWLYRNVEGAYETVSATTGISAISELRSGWGMGLVDFDSDGWRDLLVGQGHVMDDIADTDPALAHEEPLMLARNLFGHFYDVSQRAGPVFQQSAAARGVAFGDLDQDGRVDAAISVNNGPALLLKNISSGGSSLTVQLEGKGTNRDAIGAIVRVRTSAGSEHFAFQGSAGSYLSANSPDLHFGLGKGGQCESITVKWPDGSSITVNAPDGERVVIWQVRDPAPAAN